MKLFEIGSKKKSDVWMVGLNKSGAESGMRGAKEYYPSVSAAVEDHKYRVKLNPGKRIAHNIHSETDLGHFRISMVNGEKVKSRKIVIRSGDETDMEDEIDALGSTAQDWLDRKAEMELYSRWKQGGELAVEITKNCPRNKQLDWIKDADARQAARGFQRVITHSIAHSSETCLVDIIYIKD